MRLTVENLEGRDLMAAGVMAGISAPATNFTPPIGSNKGSVIEAHVRVLDITDGTSNTLAVGAGAEPQANGIIAILIGLRAPTPPAASGGLVSSFQGGCSNSGASEELAARGFVDPDDYSTPFGF